MSMEEGDESVLDAVFQEIDLAGEETLDDLDVGDVEMLDAQEGLGGGGGRSPSSSIGGGDQTEEGGRKKARKRIRKRKKNRSVGNAGGHNGGADSSIADINRFVIHTCRHLKEHKSYLLWSAIGCLGISVVKDLVKEVDAIQKCGGQKTNDGRRYRSGGGILFNILKTREPKAYKEIMAKGREFEKQLKVSKRKMITNSEGTVKNSSIPYVAAEVSEHTEAGLNGQQKLESSEPIKGHKKLADRMRVPVSYDDLFEEGEISQ